MQDIEPTFARRLKETREAAGLSQARLADLLGRREGISLDPTAITRMERGDRRIALGEAYGLARVLEVPLEYLCAPSSSDRVRELESELQKTREAISRAEVAAAKASHQVTDLRNQADLLTAALQASGGAAQRQPANDAEFQLLTAEAWRRRLAGEDLGDIARMLARVAPPGAFDSLGTVFEILRGTVPVAAIRAALDLQDRARGAVPLTSEEFKAITAGLSPDVVDQLIGAVAQLAARDEQVFVLNSIRRELDRMAADALAREWADYTGRSEPDLAAKELVMSNSPFYFSAVREEIAGYTGSDWRELAARVVPHLSPGELVTYLPHGDDGIEDLDHLEDRSTQQGGDHP